MDEKTRRFILVEVIDYISYKPCVRPFKGSFRKM
jgi:hypothetical protein